MKNKSCIAIVLAVVTLLGGCSKPRTPVLESYAAESYTEPTYTAPVETGIPSLEDDSPAMSNTEKKIMHCAILDAPNGIYVDKEELSKETNTWGKSLFEYADAPREATVCFMNAYYTGAYLWSEYSNLSSYLTDYYETDDKIKFGINDITGDLVYINYKTQEFFEQERLVPDLDNPELQVKSLVYDYAGLFVDIEEYEMYRYNVEILDPDGEGINTVSLYKYDFARSVAGIGTMDFISVHVTSKGSLASIVVGDQRAYSDMIGYEKIIESIDFDSSVAAAIESIKMHGSELSGNFIIENSRLAVTPDGDKVVCIYVSADAASGDVGFAVGIKFLIYL